MRQRQADLCEFEIGIWRGAYAATETDTSGPSRHLIHLERWFTASGQTRVTVLGPFRVKRCLKDMFRGVSSQNPYLHMLGLRMLRHVQIGTWRGAYAATETDTSGPSRHLIQLERWFTASGQTRVTVLGPFRVKRCLKDMFRGVSSQNPYLHMLGLRMLRHVQVRPLTSADLEDYFRMQS
ncbi:KH homology domain-containing protein 1 [Microtus ochrogaster]|uniref:KH homology domain-containing protein 1 n=1 Tax=Microtus ochrogaster TaxID=79684 RepID=A0A8J6KTU4_MICOH|nr:KH homology domain-containing protein 1 [Microtus ochrogaster]